MKSIATVNFRLPSVEDHLSYFSGESLRDFDIGVFDPGIPYLERVEFSGGGSCVGIDGTQKIAAAMTHWQAEMRGALDAGKTIFFLMNELTSDSGAIGMQTGARGVRNYNTRTFENYSVLPFNVAAKNSKGRKIKVVDSAFKPLMGILESFCSYKVIIENIKGKSVFLANDGSTIGGIIEIAPKPGRIVLLPYFDLEDLPGEEGRRAWSKNAIQKSHAIVAQLIAIDRSLRLEADSTPAPTWLQSAPIPNEVSAIDEVISQIDAEISSLKATKIEQAKAKDQLLSYTRLLYENGKALEAAIEDGLRILGFAVENYQAGDLEIDHIIVGPSGLRMIGESEGKDTSAIDITKFRQLETNINEDFQRDDVDVPAKGVLFGNGHRLIEPAMRADQFTAKCITNAKRLGTALVRTADLYNAVIYALDNPEDEGFLADCRAAIENTAGEVVVFPKK